MAFVLAFCVIFIQNGNNTLRKVDAAPGGDNMRGGGTAANPYLIATSAEMSAANGNIRTSGSSNFYKIESDIVYEGTWLSNNGTTPFKGTFDGGGYTITMKFTDEQEAFYGLFKYVGAGAVIKNVKINCYKSGTDTDGTYLGGRASLIYSAIGTESDPITVQNCINYGNVQTFASTTSGGSTNVGGLICEASYVNISCCANVGDVYREHDVIGGGIVGNSTTSVVVSDSYCTGFIGLREFTTDEYDKGLWGIGGTSMVNCYWIGTFYNSSEGRATYYFGPSGKDTHCYWQGVDLYYSADNNCGMSYGDLADDGKDYQAWNWVGSSWTEGLAATRLEADHENYLNLTSSNISTLEAVWDFQNTWIYDPDAEGCYVTNSRGRRWPELRVFAPGLQSLTINMDGGSYDGRTVITKGAGSTYNLPQTVTKTGYTLTGYTLTSGTGTGSLSGYTYTFGDSDGTVQAQWSIITYNITYTLNDGSISGQKTTYTVETTTFTLPTPTKSGYTFIGWTGSNGTTAQTSVSVQKGTTGHLAYTANWQVDVVKVRASVTVNNTRKYIIYMLDENNNVTKQFVAGNGTTLNFEVAQGSTFTLKVYETLYLESTIDNVKTREKQFSNVSGSSLTITISLKGAGNVNNWVVI